MSENAPTTEDVKEAYANEWDSYNGFQWDKGAAEEFDAWLAEVERAAAEKAWDRSADSAFYNPGVRGQVDHPVNPYRRKGES